ncbi:hypothetical protein C404_23205 [Ralstonia sp. AU12-08]|nr:hypothetical protein C404_23205 [Ralstonia sp. AU12-08]
MKKVFTGLMLATLMLGAQVAHAGCYGSYCQAWCCR